MLSLHARDHGTPPEGTPLSEIPTQVQQHSPLHGVVDDITTPALTGEDQQIQAQVDIDEGGADLPPLHQERPVLSVHLV
jgi:hypothetical protein